MTSRLATSVFLAWLVSSSAEAQEIYDCEFYTSALPESSPAASTLRVDTKLALELHLKARFTKLSEVDGVEKYAWQGKAYFALRSKNNEVLVVKQGTLEITNSADYKKDAFHLTFADVNGKIAGEDSIGGIGYIHLQESVSRIQKKIQLQDKLSFDLLAVRKMKIELIPGGKYLQGGVKGFPESGFKCEQSK